MKRIRSSHIFSFILILFLFHSCRVRQDVKDDRIYWAFSHELFSLLIKKDIDNSKKRKVYYPSESYRILERGSYDPLGNRSIWVKFKVQIDTLSDYSFDLSKEVKKDYQWYPSANDYLDSDKKISKENLQITYQLVTPVNFDKRSKKETYLISYGDVTFRLRVKCIEGIKHYEVPLKGHLFIKAIFSSINYDHPIYKSISIYPIKKPTGPRLSKP